MSHDPFGNWGLLGFVATHVKDATIGAVTYLRHGLDGPHFSRSDPDSKAYWIYAPARADCH